MLGRLVTIPYYPLSDEVLASIIRLQLKRIGKRITENHLKEIEGKIADLRRLAAHLRRIKNRCPGKGRIAECRILAALNPSEGKMPARPLSR